MKLANLILASVAASMVASMVAMNASASFAAAPVQNSVNLDCSVVTDGLNDSSQVVGFNLADDQAGSVRTVSSKVLKQNGCEVQLIPNASGTDPEVAGSLFIETKGWQYPFGFMLSGDVPQSCDGNSVVTVPMHVAHTSPLKIVKGCLGE